MSYRLVDSNALALKYPEVNDMPCIFADLPDGLDNKYYQVISEDVQIDEKERRCLIGLEQAYCLL